MWFTGWRVSDVQSLRWHNVDFDLQNPQFKASLKTSLREGAKEKAELSVGVGKKEEGDADNRLLEITFPGASNTTTQARQSALLELIFGAEEDPASIVQHDAELEAASDRARSKLPEFEERVKKGLAPGERILLKAPFERPDGGNEWMWVEVIKWKDDQIEGILMNQPVYIPDLKDGSRVCFAQKVVFDYLHYYPDGREEGNETGDIMRKREGTKP